MVFRRSVVLSEPSSRGFALRRIKSVRPDGRFAASASIEYSIEQTYSMFIQIDLLRIDRPLQITIICSEGI